MNVSIENYLADFLAARDAMNDEAPGSGDALYGHFIAQCRRKIAERDLRAGLAAMPGNACRSDAEHDRAAARMAAEIGCGDTPDC